MSTGHNAELEASLNPQPKKETAASRQTKTADSMKNEYTNSRTAH
jgi:hypothetical protein